VAEPLYTATRKKIIRLIDISYLHKAKPPNKENRLIFHGIKMGFPSFKCLIMHKSLNNKVLDDLNWHILEELQKNGRLPAVEIGRRVGLSAPAVADRIQKLEELGYIRGYRTVLDLDKLDLTIRAFIMYKPVSFKHAELIRFVESIPEVIEWFTITGNYAILLKVATSSSSRLAALIEQLEDTGETNTSLILDQNAEQKTIGNSR
jgi:Lrp/AsnC family transcriptional regulator, leucine-responsive regulatory protein